MNSLPDKPSIAAVLGHFYGLDIQVKGFWQKVFCPVHAETRPSASVNTDLQRWHCHACDLSEDSYAVIMREEGLTFREAVEFANSRVSGVREGVQESVSGESSRELSPGPRTGRRRKPLPPGLGRFGENWS